MKFLIVCALIACVVATPLELNEEQKAKARAHASACIEQEGITKEQAQELRDGDFAHVNDQTKCFTNCFLEKAGFLVNGEIKEDVINAKLGPIAGEENVKAIQVKCNGAKGADKCDTAFQLFKCYYENKAAII